MPQELEHIYLMVPRWRSMVEADKAMHHETQELVMVVEEWSPLAATSEAKVRMRSLQRTVVAGRLAVELSMGRLL